MNPEIKTRWVEALRSGEYEQGYGQLFSVVEPDGKKRMCCLGVLCDLYAKDHPEAFWSGGRAFIPGADAQGSRSDLPPLVQEWSGVTANGELPGEVVYTSPALCQSCENLHPDFEYTDLMGLNDGPEEFTFDFIANVIEEHL